MRKTYIYVDGFNLYYLALKNTCYKWLDLKTLFKQLLPQKDKILSIKYFTARVSGKIDPYKPIRQNTYIRALERHIPEITVHYGQFLTHIKSALLAYPTTQRRFTKIIRTEEKGSDVNLAVHLLNDAWLNAYDCAVIVSNDSDLAEALKLVKAKHRKTIGLLIPEKGHPSKELIKYANFLKRIRKRVLALSQLPDPIPGTNLHKPDTW